MAKESMNPAEMAGAILIADDNADDSRLLMLRLSRLQFPNPVFVVRNGDEVIAYLSAQGAYTDREKYPYPALLFLDLRMRPTDGFSVLRWLQHNPQLKKFPVLVLTVSEDRHEVSQAYQLGAATFITKPITRNSLSEALIGVGFQKKNGH